MVKFNRSSRKQLSKLAETAAKHTNFFKKPAARKPNGSKGLRMDLPKMACFEKVFIRESFFSADCRKKIVPCEENLGGKIWQMIGSYFVCTRKRPIIIISDLAEYCIMVKNKAHHTFLWCPQSHHWRRFARGAFWYICLCCRFC